MGLSQEESQQLFKFLSEKIKASDAQLSRKTIKEMKDQMDSETRRLFAKLMQVFPSVEELIVVKVYCQNRGNVSDAELDLKMYLQSNSLEQRKELERSKEQRKQKHNGRKLMDEKKASFVQKLKEQKRKQDEQKAVQIQNN